MLRTMCVHYLFGFGLHFSHVYSIAHRFCASHTVTEPKPKLTKYPFANAMTPCVNAGVKVNRTATTTTLTFNQQLSFGCAPLHTYDATKVEWGRRCVRASMPCASGTSSV